MAEFLRERRGDVEVSRQSERYTAADRSKALHVLRGCVVIVRHPYEADPFFCVVPKHSKPSANCTNRPSIPMTASASPADSAGPARRFVRSTPRWTVSSDD